MTTTSDIFVSEKRFNGMLESGMLSRLPVDKSTFILEDIKFCFYAQRAYKVIRKNNDENLVRIRPEQDFNAEEAGHSIVKGVLLICKGIE